MGGSTNLPGHDIPCDQLLSTGVESWRRATEVIATTVLRSMTPKKETLMEELVSRSHKQVKKINEYIS